MGAEKLGGTFMDGSGVERVLVDKVRRGDWLGWRGEGTSTPLKCKIGKSGKKQIADTKPIIPNKEGMCISSSLGTQTRRSTMYTPEAAADITASKSPATAVDAASLVGAPASGAPLMAAAEPEEPEVSLEGE